MFGTQAKLSRTATLSYALALVAGIALIDRVEPSISLGMLYVFPMILAGPTLRVWQIFLAVAFLTLLADLYDPVAINVVDQIWRDGSVYIALTGAGLYARALNQAHGHATENP